MQRPPQQLNAGMGNQSPQYGGYQASSSNSPQQNSEMIARFQSMQLDRNVSKESSLPQQPRVEFDDVQERTDKITGVTSKVANRPNGEKVLMGTEGDKEILDSSKYFHVSEFPN